MMKQNLNHSLIMNDYDIETLWKNYELRHRNFNN